MSNIGTLSEAVDPNSPTNIEVGEEEGKVKRATIKVKRRRVKTRAEKSIEEVIFNYYKLKGRYDSRYNSAKLRIIRSDASLTEKRKEAKNLKLKCVNCKRAVGTRFTTTNRHLRAVCGDESNPCKLNIDIQLGTSELFSSLELSLSHDLNIAKMRIIETKLMLLFDLITEEAMIEAFTNLKETYKSLVAADNMIQKELADQQLISPKDVMPDSVSASQMGSEDNKVLRHTLAAANEIALGGYISNFKSMIKEYENDESPDTKLAKMTEAIDIYLNNIIPTLSIIRNTLYRINTVIKQKKEYHLIQIKTPIKEQVLELEKPEILSNKK